MTAPLALGETLSLLCAVFWAGAVLFFRLSLREAIDPFSLNLFKNAVALAMFLLTIPFLPSPWEGLGPEEWLLLGISGVLGITIADTLFLAALRRLGAARNAILDCLYSPFVIVLSVCFLGENLSWVQLAGFILVLSGVLLSVWPTDQLKQTTDRLPSQELWLGLAQGTLSMFLMAAGIVLTKPVVEQASPFGVATARIAVALFSALVWLLVRRRWKSTLRRFHARLPYGKMVLGGMLGTYLALVIWIAGYKFTSASVAAVLNQTSVFFIILGAGWFLRETLNWRQYVGSILGFSGVWLIFSQGG